MSDDQKDSSEVQHTLPPEYFAPELFQPNENGPFSREMLASMALDAKSTLEANEQNIFSGETSTRLEEEEEGERDGSNQPQDLVNPMLLANNNLRGISSDQEVAKPSKRTSFNDSTRPTKHSSKNEGQHTDRRYLCYICNKLFTRRRSVRDHISKIHNTKTWEPVRSLEIIVEPTTGEPIEPLEVTIARGPPPPSTKTDKASRPAKTHIKEEVVETEEPEDQKPVEEHVLLDRDLATEPSITADATPSTLKPETVSVPSRPPSSEPFATPAPLIGKKRPAIVDAVKSLPAAAAASKKGTAKVKSTPNKKLKISETESLSTFRSPSGTPASSQRTPISKLKNQTSAASSPTPVSSRAVSLDRASSPSTSEASYSSNDDGEIFCICRKGDNHTWMIACDGGCDEWFHGNCVNIKERDGDLIDKYVCPNCQRDGFQTTWKRMCRRRGCRKPARVLQDPPSKYCSKDCGRMFFVELVRRGDPWIDTIKNGQFIIEAGRQKKLRKRRKITKNVSVIKGDGELINEGSRLATPAYSEDEKSEYETDSSVGEDLLPNRGGALRAGEVKSLVEQCKTIDQWRELGQKPVTPPRDIDGLNATIQYDEFEQRKIEAINIQMKQFENQSDLLSFREKLLELIKTRSTSIIDEVKKSNPKLKDPCGFDPRLVWSEEEVQNWINNDGKTVLESGRVGPPENLDNPDQTKTVNGINENDSENEDEKMPTKGGVCIRNRCPRHRNWAKGQLAELRFEQDVVRRTVSRLEAQAQEIKDRAVLRNWEETMAQ